MIKPAHQLLLLVVLSALFLSLTTSQRKDALDSIGIYLGNERIAIWREFGDPVEATIALNTENDTLTFWCSTDSGWMDSMSLYLTVNGVQRSDLSLSSFIDSRVLHTHFFLPLNRIAPDIETIEVWRKTRSERKAIIFHLHLQRTHPPSPYCACLDSVYLRAEDHLNRLKQITQNKATNDQTTYPELLAARKEINEAEVKCIALKQSNSEECPTKVQLKTLNDDIELIHRVIEMNANPRGCNEIEHPKE